MSNGKKPVRDSKGKIVKNLYQKADKPPKKKIESSYSFQKAVELARERKKTGRLNMDDLRNAINSVKGVTVAKSVTPAALKSVGKKINAAIPLTKKKD
jgi:hypothetical protein